MEKKDIKKVIEILALQCPSLYEADFDEWTEYVYCKLNNMEYQFAEIKPSEDFIKSCREIKLHAELD